MAATSSDKPLRRDAARNRERILAAAGELFSQRGLAATLNDVAHHAGVGVGTVYRHFPDKNELIDTLFQARVDEMVAIGEAGLADPDPWNGLVTALRGSLERQAADRALHELITAPGGMERLVRVRSRMLPIGAELVRRAQEAGALRADVEPTDLPMTQLMVGVVLDCSRDIAPDAWRRYLDVVLRGIAAHPEQVTALGAAAPSVEQVDEVLSTYKRGPS